MPRANRPDPNSVRFGEIVQRLRYEQRWTLEDLGKHAGMHPDYLGLLERGLNVPSLNTIIRLAETFDVPAATLLEPIEAYRKEIGLTWALKR